MENEIIVISAVWCPSCLILKKELKKLNEEYGLSPKMLDYDLDEDEVSEYNVGDKLPVMIVNDKRLIGEKSYEEIVNFLKECKLI
jgi:thiol-disulfide isomerase/thioredoxin